MGSRRRNFIVLGLVVVLVALSAWVVATKDTKQGIDLAGGTELVYEGRPTGANTTVDKEDIDRAIDIIRQRIDALGVSEPEISSIGETQLSISLPAVQNAQDAIDQVGQTSQLAFYDFEPNVIPPDPKVADPKERPYNRLYDAVIRSQDEEPECFEKDGKPLCTHTGPLYYLFDSGTLEPLAGPVEVKSDLFLKFNGKQPPNSLIEEVPEGYVVLRAEEPQDLPDTAIDESTTGVQGYFLLKDRPELTGDDIRNPEQNFDSFSNTPNVTFEFTDEGRKAFQEVTQRIAQRGQERAGIQGASGLSADQAASLSDSFAVVLDGEIVSRPIINFVENPSRDRRQNGRSDLGQLHDHRSPGSRRVPAHRRTADQAQPDQPVDRLGDAWAGSARRRHPRRPRRPRTGRPLPARLLPLPRRCRGRRPGRLRPLLPGDDQGDPDHSDPAGHRRSRCSRSESRPTRTSSSSSE